MDKETLIDKHLAGNLTSEEQGQFEELISSDPKFKKEVAFRKDIAAVAFENEKVELKERLATVDKKGPSKKRSNLRRILFVIVGVLLLATAIIGYQLEKMRKSPEGIYAAHYKTHPNLYHPVTRGNADLMTKAFTAYENGNYKEAAELLEERIATSRALELKFYQAMAYGEMGNLPLAIKNLENIRRFESDYFAESYWYLGLYYIKQGNKTAAIERLQTFYEATDDVDRKKTTADLIYTLQGR